MASPPVTKEAALAFGRDVYYGHGKIEILPKVAVHSLADMAVAYTPGVGHAVREIQARPEALSELTAKDNLVAIVTDGTAVLGFGNAGPRAAAPVMEGKATMFKLLAGIDCFPLCIQARDAAHLIDILEALEPGFGGYNIEDVAAPACFEVVRQLEQRVDIPAMHDDQYGTATVIAAGIINALKVTGRAAKDIRVVVNGIGAAGTATIDMLQALGVGEITAHDKAGILYRGGSYAHEHWRRIAETTNPDRLQGDLAAAMRGADVFIGVSVANQVTPEMVRSMARGPIVFGLANPEPEIRPDVALAAGAAIVASGRFDFPNHCNNVLAFPALMRAALDTKTRRVSREMCLAASRTIAAEISDAELAPDLILPSPLSATLYPNVAEAVAREAVKQGLARVDPGVGAVATKTAHLRRLVHERQRSLPASA
ncbi:NAD(P)-dependent malic enzyme [Hypericibacter sp.]|uniref:NAD(P)-dependent malic enzyme n=1 Tax=Hypericibacter sp. TaxID=2705401 RepID=UPI003D6DA5B0